MNRKAARELARTTVLSSGTYALVTEGPRRTFGGVSPVACVLSKSLNHVPLTRDNAHDQADLGLSVSIYVLCEAGGEDAAEDQLDTLVEAAFIALKNAGFLVGESDASPDGAPLRDILGKFYRIERIPITIAEYL